MRRAFSYLFSKSKMQVFFLKDCDHGFQGEIQNVKPGFAQKCLIPQVLAMQNLPGYRKRLLPNLDEDLLKTKIKRRQQIREFQQKISGLYLDFVRMPKFSNPNQMKEAIDDSTIIEELRSRFKLSISKNNLLEMTSKIREYGQFTINVQNFYSEEMGDYITFPIVVTCRKPVIKQQKLLEEGGDAAEKAKGQGEQKDEQTQVNQTSPQQEKNA